MCSPLTKRLVRAVQAHGRAGDLLWRGHREPADGDAGDWRGRARTGLAACRSMRLAIAGHNHAVQGNLDPITLFAPSRRLLEQAREARF